MPSFIYLFLVTPEANAQQALPISTFRFSTHPLLGLDKPHTHCLKHLNVRTCERTSCLYAQAPSCPPTHLHKAAALLPALTTQVREAVNVYVRCTYCICQQAQIPFPLKQLCLPPMAV